MSDDATAHGEARGELLAEHAVGVLRALAASGVYVELRGFLRGSGSVCDGVDLNADDAAKILRCGPDEFWAEKYGITVNEFRRWREHHGSCSARTPRGRCGNNTTWTASGYLECPSPGRFVWGVDDRCEYHGGPPRSVTAKKRSGPIVHVGLVGSSHVLCGFVLAEPLRRELGPAVMPVAPWSKRASDLKVTTDVRDATCTQCCAVVGAMRSRHATGTNSHAVMAGEATTICAIELKTALPTEDTVGVIQPVACGKAIGARVMVVDSRSAHVPLVTCPLCLGHETPIVPNHVLFKTPESTPPETT